ncbi:MAG: hypothetical protein ABI373_10345 [Flavobacteriales bacterium]
MNTSVRGTLTISLIVLALPAAFAQTPIGPNLVPNGGFEMLDKEPKTFDQLSLASGWGNVTIGYSEVFSSTANVKTVGIPENFYGTIKPLEGAHYAGFFSWKDDKQRNYEGDPQDPFEPGWNAYSEYPSIELLSPLKEGHTYEITFHIALAGNSDRAVSGIGAYVSPLELHYQNRKFMTERPQVVEDTIVDQRGIWKEVKGMFKADGGERYLIIGTFPTSIFETKRIIDGPDNQYAYYYLDEIELREVSPEK